MPLDLFHQIIDLVSGLGIRNVTLTGGEPTIYPHILEAIRCCKDHGLNVTIPTNGLAFALRDRLEQFCEAGVDRIGMSVKGHDRQSYLDPTFSDALIERHWLSIPCQLHRHDGLIFDTEGRVIPCNAMPGVRLGRIHEDFSDVESFWEFWSSSKVEDVFSKYRSAPDARCTSCGKRSRCRGGCVSNWLNYSFDDIRGYLHEA